MQEKKKEKDIFEKERERARKREINKKREK